MLAAGLAFRFFSAIREDVFHLLLPVLCSKCISRRFHASLSHRIFRVLIFWSRSRLPGQIYSSIYHDVSRLLRLYIHFIYNAHTGECCMYSTFKLQVYRCPQQLLIGEA
jgi:hypothetical protein